MIFKVSRINLPIVLQMLPLWLLFDMIYSTVSEQWIFFKKKTFWAHTQYRLKNTLILVKWNFFLLGLLFFFSEFLNYKPNKMHQHQFSWTLFKWVRGAKNKDQKQVSRRNSWKWSYIFQQLPTKFESEKKANSEKKTVPFYFKGISIAVIDLISMFG